MSEDKPERFYRASSMPPEIADAICAVMTESRRLGVDEKNEHGRYEYVSIDKFLEFFGPLMARAGLFVLIDESSIEVRSPTVEGKSAWLLPRYEVWLAHRSGVVWGPLRRHLALPLTGPQTFGAAESYVQKRLLRGLFMTPTGERDADAVAADGGMPAAEPAKKTPAVSAEDRARASRAYKRLTTLLEHPDTELADLESNGVFSSNQTTQEELSLIRQLSPETHQRLVQMEKDKRRAIEERK